MENSNSQSYKNKESGFSFFFKYKSTKSQSSETSKWEEEMKDFFSETQGEVYVSEVSCQLYTMELTNFLKFEFTPNFINGLRSLQFAAKHAEYANDIFTNFVNEFGTFYLKDVSMGAKLFIETRFASSSKSAAEATKRINCIHNSYAKSTDVGFEKPKVELTVGAEGKASAKGEIPAMKIGSKSGSGLSNGRCLKGSQNSGYFSKSGMSSTEIYSIGSTPAGDLASWIKDDSFIPVPISYSLEPIYKLMWQTVWEFTRPEGNVGDISLNPNEPNGEKLNGKLIERFFKDKLEQYCTVVLGEETCTITEEKGCGINSICPNDKICTTASNEFGYRCAGKIIFRA